MLANIPRRVASPMRKHLLKNDTPLPASAVHYYFSLATTAQTSTVRQVASTAMQQQPRKLTLTGMMKSQRVEISGARTTTAACRRFSSSKDPNGDGEISQDNEAKSPTQQTRSFLLSLGYNDDVSEGIIGAILQNGIPQSSLFGMVKGLAGRYEVGEDGGLEALAASVQLELDKVDAKDKVKVWCLPSTGWSPADDDDQTELPIVHSMDRAFVVEASEGTTLTDVAKFGTSDNADILGEYLECACSGIMACSTCHVVIHPDWYDVAIDAPDATRSSDATLPVRCPNKVVPPSEAEQDMIDLAYQPQVTSRLGCQIKLTKDLDGLVILLPKGANNLMDHIPFD
ncbi:hypothetical protein ACHAWF_007497 [Thalassiosira exigua]